MKTQVASGRRNELDNNQISVGQPFLVILVMVVKIRVKELLDSRWSGGWGCSLCFNEYIKDGSTLKSTALATTAKYGELLGRKFSVGSIEHILTYESYHTGIKK